MQKETYLEQVNTVNISVVRISAEDATAAMANVVRHLAVTAYHVCNLIQKYGAFRLATLSTERDVQPEKIKLQEGSTAEEVILEEYEIEMDIVDRPKARNVKHAKHLKSSGMGMTGMVI